jgi:hypothetical protein
LWNYRSSKVEAELPINAEVEFSLSRYEPMARLLSDEDFDFIQSQPGFRPEIGRKFRRERRRVFRLYLQELAGDFHRLHARARAAVATLPAEHSALVGILMRSQLRFWYEITALELRLSLSWAGSSVDARGLVEAIGAMHVEVNRLAAPSFGGLTA